MIFKQMETLNYHCLAHGKLWEQVFFNSKLTTCDGFKVVLN